MGKRGQTTYFLIIALIILIIISTIIYFKKTAERSYQTQEVIESRFITTQANKLKDGISSCVEETNFIGLKLIGKNGGYLEIPEGLLVKDTVYWYKEGINFQPFLSEVESRQEKYLIDNLHFCFNRVLEKNRNFNLTSGSLNARVKFGDGFIVSSIDYPIIINTGRNGFRLEKFEIKQKTAFWNLYEKATRIVNDASLPSFDTCEPVKCSDENSNFVFLNDKDNLIVRGQTFILFQNGTRTNLELKFAIKRPIKESFGLGFGKKKVAIIYQDSEGTNIIDNGYDPRTFGKKALSIFEKILPIGEGIDTFDCKQIQEFFAKAREYGILIITGNAEAKVAEGKRIIILPSGEKKEETFFGEDKNLDPNYKLKIGCNQISKNYQLELKNWVSNGGILWINFVSKYEGNDFAASYLGAMGYSSEGWHWGVKDLYKGLIDYTQQLRETSTTINKPNHKILYCPNNITKELSTNVWFGGSLNTKGNADDIILGSDENSKLWIDHIGNGLIIFDEYVLKDNIFGVLPYQDDLYSKGIAEQYFINVLTYLSKLAYESKEIDVRSRPIILMPISNKEISNLSFMFQSILGKDKLYYLSMWDINGSATTFMLNPSNFDKKENLNGENKIWSYNKEDNKIEFFVKPLTGDKENRFNEGIYEWQVGVDYKGRVVWGNVGRFIKKSSEAKNEN